MEPCLALRFPRQFVGRETAVQVGRGPRRQRGGRRDLFVIISRDETVRPPIAPRHLRQRTTRTTANLEHSACRARRRRRSRHLNHNAAASIRLQIPAARGRLRSSVTRSRRCGHSCGIENSPRAVGGAMWPSFRPYRPAAKLRPIVTSVKALSSYKLRSRYRARLPTAALFASCGSATARRAASSPCVNSSRPSRARRGAEPHRIGAKGPWHRKGDAVRVLRAAWDLDGRGWRCSAWSLVFQPAAVSRALLVLSCPPWSLKHTNSVNAPCNFRRFAT